MQEAGLLGLIRHPNVLLIMTICLHPPALITEFCGWGSLYDVIAYAHNSKDPIVALPWLRRSALGVTMLSAYLEISHTYAC